jgi:hypothetical protein
VASARFIGRRCHALPDTEADHFSTMGKAAMSSNEEIRLCEVSNEQEAAMVVNLLREEGLPARSDATQSMNLFGGLPFEPGHSIFIPKSVAAKALSILGNYPHFKALRNVHVPGV